VNLNGTLSAAVVTSGDNPPFFGQPGSHYTNWELALSGLDSSNSFSVAVGDTINVTIQLDHSFLFPAPPVSFQSFTFWLKGSPSAIGFNTTTEVNLTPLNGANAGPTYSSTGCGAGSSVGASPFLCASAFYSNISPIQFDSLLLSMQVISLTSPFVVNGTYFSWNLQTPVPEAPTLALMLLGMSLVLGATSCKRKSLQDQTTKDSQLTEL
jgi:hypothetical protein